MFDIQINKKVISSNDKYSNDNIKLKKYIAEIQI